MKVVCECNGKEVAVEVGAGLQNIRWLGIVCALRYQQEFFPHAFMVPQRIFKRNGHQVELLKPRGVLKEILKDGSTIVVELRKGATIPADLYDEDAAWIEDAYGSHSNLMDLRFQWKISPDSSEIPTKVRGHYTVSNKWEAIFPQSEHGGSFESPVEAVEVGDRHDWIATKKGPPGTCIYKFVMDDGREATCTSIPTTSDGKSHFSEFGWDCPIAADPNPGDDSRPSSASSAATINEEFKNDEQALRLSYLEPSMQRRVKDVFREFYDSLSELFYTFAFVNADTSHTEQTIGMDDMYLILNDANLLQKIDFTKLCDVFVEVTGKQGGPYFPQRLERTDFLNMVLSLANVYHGNDVEKNSEEALFRFLADSICPVLDAYDKDNLRMMVVEQGNLVAIQRHRSAMRSIYDFLCQKLPSFHHEPMVTVACFGFTLEHAMNYLAEDAEVPAGVTAFKQSSENYLTSDQLNYLIGDIDIISRGLDALGFWQFFEVIVKCCLHLTNSVADRETELDPALQQLVSTLMESVRVMTDTGVDLPALDDPDIASDAAPVAAEA